MIHVLLVEDDPVLSRGLQVNLELEGYRVSWASNLKTANEIQAKEKINLVILDLGLPDGSGFDFLTHLRQSGLNIPVIILTAQTHEDSVVKGLELGANDYMKKPFGNRELFARIKTVLREPLVKQRQLQIGDVAISIEQRAVTVGGKIIDLNRREFDILLHFCERPENIVTRDALLQLLDKDGEIYDRTIDSHVSHLRTRLKNAGVTGLKISSVYGVGYRLEKLG